MEDCIHEIHVSFELFQPGGDFAVAAFLGRGQRLVHDFHGGVQLLALLGERQQLGHLGDVVFGGVVVLALAAHDHLVHHAQVREGAHVGADVAAAGLELARHGFQRERCGAQVE